MGAAVTLIVISAACRSRAVPLPPTRETRGVTDERGAPGTQSIEEHLAGPACDRDVLDQLVAGWIRQCWQRGLEYNPAFASGGRGHLRWRGNDDGKLVTLDFDLDPFPQLAIDATGATLLDCVRSQAQRSHARWTGSCDMPFVLAEAR